MHSVCISPGCVPCIEIAGHMGCICSLFIDDANFPKWLCKFAFQEAIELPAFFLLCIPDVSPVVGYILQIFSPTLWLVSSMF